MRASDDESPATVIVRTGPEVSALSCLSSAVSALTAALEQKCDGYKKRHDQ